jgi:hypothetical protein
MSEYLKASCSLPRIVRQCLNEIFDAIEKHLLTHRRRHTVAIGNNKYETRYGQMSFMGLDFRVEDVDGKEYDYFEKDSVDETVFIIITCGCGESFVIAPSIFDQSGYDINSINYIEIAETFVETIKNRYNKKESNTNGTNGTSEQFENKASKNPLYGLDPK